MKWTREKAIAWVEEHQYIIGDADFPNFILDGDGNDLLEVKLNRFMDLETDELAELLIFILNDYATL